MIALDKPNLFFVVGLPLFLMAVAFAISLGIYVAMGGRREG